MKAWTKVAVEEEERERKTIMFARRWRHTSKLFGVYFFLKG